MRRSYASCSVVSHGSGEWSVVAEHEADGATETTVFSGLNAEIRAIEYAAVRYGRQYQQEPPNV